MGTKLAEDPRYGRSCGTSRLAKMLAVYDQSHPGAARAIIVAGSDFDGTSPKLFWPETLVYLLPGAELNEMLTLIVAIKSETPCEPELLLFAGMNDHLHAAGLLEPLRSWELTTKKIWEAIQTLFAAMNEVQELVTSRLGSKTRVVFASSPVYANMPPALNFVYAMLVLNAKGNGWRVLMADVSHALRGFYELADILIVLDEVLCLEGSNLARQLKFNPEVDDDDHVITDLTASLWFRSMEPTITSSTWLHDGAKQREKECGGSRKTSGIDRIPSNTRERKMAVPDPET